MRLANHAVALAITTATIVGCQKPPPAGGPTKPVVFVTLQPQRYFVERIGGEHVAARVLIAPGSPEHSYDPTPQQIVELGSAAAYFRIGVISETRVVEQLQRAHPNLAVFDTREKIALRTLCEAEHGESPELHHAEDDHGHGHTDYGGKDPHIWLDPILVKQQAATIAGGLAKVDPAHASEYSANLAAFEHELDALDAKLRATLAAATGREFLVFHPTFGYFADRYGLKQVSVEVEGKEPTPRELDGLIARAKQTGTKTIFCQPQFSDRAARAVAEAIGGRVVMLDPLSADYPRNMLAIAEQIAAALKEPK
ncbi:MAG: zinc ABC transporter substrate-binding protein [Planctomycetes bacterium]|nr:zinc ABC transporter substrate-binding protein [Planctomycetota bacterium]